MRHLRLWAFGRNRRLPVFPKVDALRARVDGAAGPDGPGRQGFCPGPADASRTGSGLPPSGGMKHRCAGEVRRPYGRPFIIKPLQSGFRPSENHTTALRARKCIPPLVAGATTFPPQFGGATKGKRLNGQTRRLTSPHLEVLCRTSTVAL